MRMRGLILLALAGVLGFSTAAPAQTPAKPGVLLRLKPLEELIADLRFVVKETGREQQGKQFEALLKSRTGPNGLEGVDVKKPIGLFANLKASLPQSEVLLLLPIASEKAFLDFLDALNFKAEKAADGLYTMQVENVPVPLLFRFANGYLYGTARLSDKTTVPPADKLPDPAKVLGESGGILSLLVNVDQIPEAVRKFAISAAALQLGEAKERDMPGATERQKALQGALLDELSGLVKVFLEDATRSELKIDLDRKTKDISLSFNLAGKPGSTLTKNLAALTPASSPAAGIVGKDSVMGGLLYLALPEAVRKAAEPAIDEAIAKALDNGDPNVKTLLTPLVDTLKPTAKAGKLDAGLDMRGPGKKGKYTLVASGRVEKGGDIEKAVKALLDQLPADAKEPIQVDVATEAGVNIHSVKQKDVDEQAKELFGDGPLYFAVRDDVLVVTLGEDALDAIKTAVKAKPAIGQPLKVTLSASRLAPLMKKDQPAAPEAAKKAFVEKDSDQLRLSLTTGDRLELKLSLKTALLAFASYLDEAKNKE